MYFQDYPHEGLVGMALGGFLDLEKFDGDGVIMGTTIAWSAKGRADGPSQRPPLLITNPLSKRKEKEKEIKSETKEKKKK